MGKNSSKKGQDFINKTKNTIDNTIDNYRETEKRINEIDDEIKKSEMEIQNLRREQSIRNLNKEINNVVDKENNFKYSKRYGDTPFTRNVPIPKSIF